MAPALVDHTANGSIAGLMGNDDLTACPHGVYPADGEDQWLAVACPDDDSWRRLCEAIGRNDLLADPALATADGRRAAQAQIDQAIAEWSAARPASAAQEQLQGAGVPSHQVQNSPECVADPQLRHLGHFVTVDHSVIGPHVIEAPRIRLSRTPGSPRAGAPALNEHLFEVLNGLLGYDADQIGDLVALDIFR
jgi:benzylsuccinate CoA-transferase BbsF subunit